MNTTKQMQSLIVLHDKVGYKMDTLQKKIDAIDERCSEQDRDLNSRELEMVLRYTDEKVELHRELRDIEKAIDLLRKYAW